MKKIIVLLMLVFIGASTTIYAQESKSESRRAERKAQRDAEKAREKIEEERAYTDASHKGEKVCIGSGSCDIQKRT